MGSSAIEGVPATGSGSGGAVSSVNTRTGAVVLTAADVGAGQLPVGVLLPSGVAIPANASAATQAANDNSTKPATTAYADAAVAVEAARAAAAEALLAPKASPALTGNPTVPTAAADTNTTQAASTANVVATAAQKSTLTTKGDIYVATAASTPTRLAVGTSLTQRLIADSSQPTGLKWVPHIVTRTTDATAITANTTLASDDTLLFAIAANEVWYFIANIIATAANTTMDMKVGLSVPASATADWGAVGPASASSSGWGASLAANTPAILAAAGTLPVGSSNNARMGLGLAGVVQNGANAGNVNLQFAQNTSDAGALTIKAYSHMILWRLA